MSTSVSYVKGGTVISCSSSTLPRPRPEAAWPVPAFDSTSLSLLSLTLVPVAQTGRSGVQVQSTPVALPGNASASWTLRWIAYQGSAPANPTWHSVPVTWPGVNLLLDNVMPSATLVAYLQRVEAGQTYTYAQISIATPTDPTQANISSAAAIGASALGVGSNLIPNFDSELGPIAGIGGNLVYDTSLVDGFSHGYLGSRYVRALNQSAANIVSGTLAAGYPFDTPIPCQPGDVFYVSAVVRAANVSTTARLAAVFYDSGGNVLPVYTAQNYLTFPTITGLSAGTWYAAMVRVTGNNIIQTSGQYNATAYFCAPANAASMVLVSTATDSIEAWFDNIQLYKGAPLASSSTPGVVKVAANLQVDTSGNLSVPAATTSIPGVVQVDGTTITVNNGVISAAQYTLPTASTTVLGGVKVDGTTITVNAQGVISATAPAGSAAWGSITGTTAQAAPSSWTGTSTFAGPISGTSASFSGNITINGSTFGWGGTGGTYSQAKTGGTYDWSVVNTAGTGYILGVPTGTSNLTLMGTLTGTSASFSGNVSATSFAPTADVNQQGEIALSASGGLYLRGKTGSVYDFGIQNAAGNGWIIGNPTGTNNLVMPSVGNGGLTLISSTPASGGASLVINKMTSTNQAYISVAGDTLYMGSGASTSDGTIGCASGTLHFQAGGYADRFTLNSSQATFSVPIVGSTYIVANNALIGVQSVIAGNTANGGYEVFINPGSSGVNAILQSLQNGVAYLGLDINHYGGTVYANGSPVLTLANVGTNAATLQAAVSSATAPSVGTNAQMQAWTPPAGLNPYWYATDVTNSVDGTMGTLFQWNGSAWVNTGTAQVITPKITAGNISAGAIGALAINTNDLRSQSYSGTGTHPTGFRFSGNTFSSSAFYDGVARSVLMELGGNVNFAGFYLSDIAVRSMSALDSNGQTGTAFRTWYRGNNDPGTNGGAPNASCLSLSCIASAIDSSFQKVWWSGAITPSSYANNTDNLDGLRYIRVRLYYATTSTSPLADFAVPVGDRLYDGSSGVYKFSFSWAWRYGVSQGPGLYAPNSSLDTNGLYNGYVRLTLYNAVGHSADIDFAPNTVPGTNCTVTTITGASGAGGNGGGYCPAPDVPLLMADGSEKPAGEIRVGDRVQAWDEEAGRFCVETVTHAIPGFNSRWTLRLSNGREGRFAANHRFLLPDGGWVELQHLTPGTTLAGGLRVVNAEPEAFGPVCKITINRVHTYQTLGVISHNVKNYN